MAVLTSDLPTLLGVTTGIAVLAGLICMVLHLFSKTKYPRHRNYADANIPPPIMYSTDTGTQRNDSALNSYLYVTIFSRYWQYTRVDLRRAPACDPATASVRTAIGGRPVRRSVAPRGCWCQPRVQVRPDRPPYCLYRVTFLRSIKVLVERPTITLWPNICRNNWNNKDTYYI